MPMIPPMLRILCAYPFLAVSSLVFVTSCQPFDATSQANSNHQLSPFPQQHQTVGLAKVPVGKIPFNRPPSIYAESAIVVDVETKRVLYAKNADQKRAVASTQKLITALCVLDAGNLDKKITITRSDGYCEPTKLGLKAGDTYTRRELLQVLLIKSANDVARALARDVAGSQAAFARMMNRKCADLGMRNSHFKNPHGLTEGGQYSTARDMAIAGLAAYKLPIVREYTDMESFRFRLNNGRSILLNNTNKVLRELSYCNGMKTGTTRASGRCLVASGKMQDREVVSVVLKSNSRNIWSDSKALLRWALVR